MLHKYLFFIIDSMIKIYSYEDKKFKLIRHSGEEYFEGEGLDSVFKWFKGFSAITKKDFIDFCFIIDNNEYNVIDLLKEYNKKDETTWTMNEIEKFLCEESKYIYCEILINGKTKINFQNGNIPRAEKIPKLYIKCIPELKNINEKINDNANDNGEISPLAKHFIKKFKNIQENL